MKSKLTWLFFGLIIFSLVIGIMTGLSNSPVVGVATTSIFGLGVSVIGLFAKNQAQRETADVGKQNLNLIGKLIATFSIFFAIGISLGIYIRFAQNPPKTISFIWDETNKPSSTYEALDWIMINKTLKDEGYTDGQIKSLYEMWVKERSKMPKGGTDSMPTKYDPKNSPLSKILSPPLSNKAEQSKAANTPLPPPPQ